MRKKKEWWFEVAFMHKTPASFQMHILSFSSRHSFFGFRVTEWYLDIYFLWFGFYTKKFNSGNRGRFMWMQIK